MSANYGCLGGRGMARPCSPGPVSPKTLRRGRLLPIAAAVCAAVLALSCASSPAIHASRSQNDDQIGEWFSAHGIAEYPSSRPLLYFSGPDWARRALEMIRNAKDYILISSYLTNYHESNAPIFEALVEKAKQGVRVYLMFDSSSYFTFMPDQVSYIQTALSYFKGTPVQVCEYNPITGSRFFSTPFLFDRDHRKFWIVDGEYLAAGGMNLNYYSLVEGGVFRNIDTFVEIQSPGATDSMVASFCETWNRYSPDPIRKDSFAIPAVGTSQSIWLIDQELDEPSTVDPLFDAFFRFARQDIWMIQAYAFVTPGLIAKIKSAVDRGVRVHLLLSTNAFRAEYEYAARYKILDLIDAGAEVYMYARQDSSFLHYKLLLADKSLAAFGSPNFNFRSQFLSREVAIVSENPEVCEQARSNLEELLAWSYVVTREEAKKYRGLPYLVAYLLMQFGG